MNPEIQALRSRVQALSPRARKALLKELERFVRDYENAGTAKPRSRKAVKPVTWRLGKSPVSPTAPSQRITAAAKKKTTAKRLGLRTPIRYDEET